MWQYELDVLLRATGFGAISRSALEIEGEENPATFTYGAGAAAIFVLVDWLSLDVGYSFAGQFNPEVEDEALSQVSQAGFIKVHTVLVGLSARTYLSRGQRVFGEGKVK